MLAGHEVEEFTKTQLYQSRIQIPVVISIHKEGTFQTRNAPRF